MVCITPETTWLFVAERKKVQVRWLVMFKTCICNPVRIYRATAIYGYIWWKSLWQKEHCYKWNYYCCLTVGKKNRVVFCYWLWIKICKDAWSDLGFVFCWYFLINEKAEKLWKQSQITKDSLRPSVKTCLERGASAVNNEL